MLNTVMRADLRRMAENGAPQLFGRTSADPDILAEMAFRDSHNGMSRADYALREQMRARNDFESNAVADLGGDPPGVPTMSATPQRARWDRYREWRASEKLKLTELESRRAELLGPSRAFRCSSNVLPTTC